IPFGIPKGARCVQRFDDSLNSAIHITYRISLRSSSMREPRDPLLKVVFDCVFKANNSTFYETFRVYKGKPRERPTVGSQVCCGFKSSGVHMPPRRPATTLTYNSIMILPQVHL